MRRGAHRVSARIAKSIGYAFNTQEPRPNPRLITRFYATYCHSSLRSHTRPDEAQVVCRRQQVLGVRHQHGGDKDARVRLPRLPGGSVQNDRIIAPISA
jgi:hypothetical protein